MANWVYELSHVSNRFKAIFFWKPLKLFMFLRIAHLASSTEQILLCLADISLSRILNHCQLFSKGHGWNLTRKHKYRKCEHSLCVGISQNDDMPRTWIKGITARSPPVRCGWSCLYSSKWSVICSTNIHQSMTKG